MKSVMTEKIPKTEKVMQIIHELDKACVRYPEHAVQFKAAADLMLVQSICINQIRILLNEEETKSLR